MLFSIISNSFLNYFPIVTSLDLSTAAACAFMEVCLQWKWNTSTDPTSERSVANGFCEIRKGKAYGNSMMVQLRSKLLVFATRPQKFFCLNVQTCTYRLATLKRKEKVTSPKEVCHSQQKGFFIFKQLEWSEWLVNYTEINL